METIAISKFKATCLAVLERVRVTGEPILVTRFGEAVAEVSPPKAVKGARRRLGDLAGTAQILGDLIAPATSRVSCPIRRSPAFSLRMPCARN